jgi:hypothetical protein
VTNDYSDIQILQPILKLNCQKQNTLVSVHYMDESDGLLVSSKTQQLMQILNQGIKIERKKLIALEFNREYRIGVYMYYKQIDSNEVKVYMKYIKVARILTQGVLVA